LDEEVDLLPTFLALHEKERAAVLALAQDTTSPPRLPIHEEQLTRIRKKAALYMRPQRRSAAGDAVYTDMLACCSIGMRAASGICCVTLCSLAT
jgi:hypothetical protein